MALCQRWGYLMEIDEEKVDDMVLGLLYLTTFEDKPRLRAWKGARLGCLRSFCIGRNTSPILQRKQNQLC